MVHVFQTSVNRRSSAPILEALLNRMVAGGRWNFDWHDKDNILRVETELHIASRIIDVLTQNGFDCKELTDTVV
ncbi:MAG: hypothetical protein H7Y31_09005 [Chitinophagaceae bacterium]|nr:hypothetical protein [Chitinophagaceae bacterium]